MVFFEHTQEHYSPNVNFYVFVEFLRKETSNSNIEINRDFRSEDAAERYYFSKVTDEHDYTIDC